MDRPCPVGSIMKTSRNPASFVASVSVAFCNSQFIPLISKRCAWNSRSVWSLTMRLSTRKAAISAMACPSFRASSMRIFCERSTAIKPRMPRALRERIRKVPMRRPRSVFMTYLLLTEMMVSVSRKRTGSDKRWNIRRKLLRNKGATALCIDSGILFWRNMVVL